MDKPIEEIEAKSVDPGLIIRATIATHSTSCILDTGSTFCLLPHHVWENLKLNKNLLNTKVQYNISSASHKVNNAVAGQIILNFTIYNKDGDTQIIRQNCLVLRPTLDLQYVLLGNDYLSNNDVQILFSQ